MKGGDTMKKLTWIIWLLIILAAAFIVFIGPSIWGDPIINLNRWTYW